jgi:hypothetical protein
MTVKEIAAAVGKSEDSVQRWIKKILDQPQNAVGINEKNSLTSEKISLVNSIKEKAGSKDGIHPADYTFEETLLIIEVGMGKNAAGVYRASAVNSTAQNDVLAKLDRIEKTIKENNNQKALPDPKSGAYRELEDFVERTLEVDHGRIYRVYVWELYHTYEKEVQNPLNRQEFMYRIALNHPEYELKLSKKDWYFTRCSKRRIL